ncbi:hypothetical protein BHE74_00001071 [Ensete ventricosum]|nr:hypothetical protein BHE74_00001071 [Ensete ventricosum]
MSRIFADNAHSIGNTPLVQINRIAPRGVTILAKIEGRNPGYSVKCRIGANMIWDAESTGKLKPGMTIVEPTSGNTGIGLAFVAAARGYKLLLTMPASMSIERRKVLKALGAELVLTEPAKGMKGAIEKAGEIVASDPAQYFMPGQFENPANPAIHEKTTGPEIWNDTDGAIDVLVAGVGTGGTITGVSRYIKNIAGKPILSVAVEPIVSPVITQALAGDEIKPSPHKIQGIGAGFVPKNLDLSMVDRVELASDEESKAMALRLMQEEGILCGISCGAAMAVAVRLAEKPEMQGKTIVVILPDSGERYLSCCMTFSLAAKLSVLALFIGSTLYVHLRGKARLPLLRQFVNHSALFAPYNALMYLFSAVPSKPYLDRSKFPELDVLKDNWEVIREEAMHLFDEGYIRAAEKNNDAGFGSFFKKGWKRFYLKWYDKPLPSAEALCPKTVTLVSSIPNVKGAMFALLPGGSHLNPHRDPFAGSLRYHLGLSTPNSDDCRIFVDGQVYAWRDGEDVMFDETYVHWVKNETEQTRVILFCDIERPLSNGLMTRVNRWVSKQLGRATAPQNLDDERVGGINQAYAWSKTFSDKFSGVVKQWKRKHPKAYRIARPVLAVVVLVLLWKWLFG